MCSDTPTPETIKAPAAQEDEQQAEIPTSNEASGGSGWWSGWGMSNLSNLSSVVHNTTNIVQKSVQNTTNIVQKSVSFILQHMVFNSLDFRRFMVIDINGIMLTYV